MATTSPSLKSSGKHAHAQQTALHVINRVVKDSGKSRKHNPGQCANYSYSWLDFARENKKDSGMEPEYENDPLICHENDGEIVSSSSSSSSSSSLIPERKHVHLPEKRKRLDNNHNHHNSVSSISSISSSSSSSNFFDLQKRKRLFFASLVCYSAARPRTVDPKTHSTPSALPASALAEAQPVALSPPGPTPASPSGGSACATADDADNSDHAPADSLACAASPQLLRLLRYAEVDFPAWGKKS
jgi:hypothetical protein